MTSTVVGTALDFGDVGEANVVTYRRRQALFALLLQDLLQVDEICARQRCCVDQRAAGEKGEKGRGPAVRG